MHGTGVPNSAPGGTLCVRGAWGQRILGIRRLPMNAERTMEDPRSFLGAPFRDFLANIEAEDAARIVPSE